MIVHSHMCTGVKTVTKHEGFYLCLFWIVFCVVIILTHIYPLLPKMEPSCSLGKLGQAVFEALQVLASRAPGSQGRWAVLKRHLPKPQAPQASILKAWHFTTVTNWFRWGKKKIQNRWNPIFGKQNSKKCVSFQLDWLQQLLGFFVRMLLQSPFAEEKHTNQRTAARVLVNWVICEHTNRRERKEERAAFKVVYMFARFYSEWNRSGPRLVL